MGYMFVMGACIACKQRIVFNPHSVPSIRIDGKREPVCKTCVALANPKRVANGLPPIEVRADAYEPTEE